MWNLSNIYESFECKKFKKDFQALEGEVHAIESWMEVNLKTTDAAKDKIEYFIKFKNEASDLYYKIGTYSYLNLTADTKNTLASENFNKILNIEQKIQLAENKFKSWLFKINDVHGIISNDKFLKDYEFYIDNLLDGSKHMPSESESILFSKMKDVSSNAWESLYRQVLSSAKAYIEVNDKKEKLPLQVIQGILNSDNKELRKKAYKAEIQACDNLSSTVTLIYNSIKGEQIIEAELKGYKSVLQMAMKSYNLSEVTLHTMFRTIEKYVSVIQKGVQCKAKLLENKDSIPFYDLYAPLGKQEKTYTFQEIKSIILNNLKDYGGKMYTVAEKIFSENWIDEEPRENKRTGGFTSNIHSIKESRILFNFTGSPDNILQLAHEIGHAYHNDCLNNESCINSICSLAVMESAAIFSENFLQNRILEISSKEEKLKILNEFFIRDMRLILDIYAYFIFETKVFEIRKVRTISQDELCNLLKNAFYKAYGTSIEKETINQYMWMLLPQLFYPNRPYYMVSYAFGLLFTKGLYSVYLKDKKKFISDFEHFLTISGKYSVEDAAKKLNIDLTKEDFWIDSLKIVEKEIEDFNCEVNSLI